jgi:hypothetical protein
VYRRNIGTAVLGVIAFMSAIICAQAGTITLSSLGTGVDPNQFAYVPLGAGSPTSTVVTDVHSLWATPTVGSSWVSYNAHTGDYLGQQFFDVPADSVVRFVQTFNLVSSPISGSIFVMADDAASVTLNGQLIFPEAPGGIYAVCSDDGITCSTPTEVILTPFLKLGFNELDFDVHQSVKGGSFGLNYFGTVEEMPEPGSLALMGAGMLLLVAVSRRYRKP